MSDGNAHSNGGLGSTLTSSLGRPVGSTAAAARRSQAAGSGLHPGFEQAGWEIPHDLGYGALAG